MIVLLARFLVGATLAAGPSPVGTSAPMSTEEYVYELTTDRRPDRLYAARELRRRVRHALQNSQRQPGTLRHMSAVQELLTYDQLVAPRCLAVMIEYIELRVPCVEILGMLETDDARATIQLVMEAESRRWALRRMESALRTLPAAHTGPEQ